jgi:hypothetical protein
MRLCGDAPPSQGHACDVPYIPMQRYEWIGGEDDGQNTARHVINLKAQANPRSFHCHLQVFIAKKATKWTLAAPNTLWMLANDPSGLCANMFAPFLAQSSHTAARKPPKEFSFVASCLEREAHLSLAGVEAESPADSLLLLLEVPQALPWSKGVRDSFL